MITEKMTVREYTDVLSSKAPVPGGGGASALAGALAASLAQMVCGLTIGKKKYADAEEEMKRIAGVMKEKQETFLALADRDAEVFEPLSKAYSLPSGTEEEKQKKTQAMEGLLVSAAQVPLSVMEETVSVLDELEILLEKGSSLAVSDVGVSASFFRCAVTGAMLNVQINTRLIQDKNKADEIERKAGMLLAQGQKKTDEITEQVGSRLKK